MCVHFVHDPFYAYLALRYIALLHINFIIAVRYIFVNFNLCKERIIHMAQYNLDRAYLRMELF